MSVDLRYVDVHLGVLQSLILIPTLSLHDKVCWEGENDGEDDGWKCQVEIGVAGVKSDGKKGVDD